MSTNIKKGKSLEEYRQKIEDEIEYLDERPYSANLISIRLQIIRDNWGKKEANKAIRDFGLEDYGWKIAE